MKFYTNPQISTELLFSLKGFFTLFLTMFIRIRLKPIYKIADSGSFYGRFQRY